MKRLIALLALLPVAAFAMPGNGPYPISGGGTANGGNPTFASVTISSGATNIASAHGATGPSVFTVTGTAIADGTYIYSPTLDRWNPTNGTALANSVQIYVADLGWMIYSPSLSSAIKGNWGEDGYYQPLTDPDLEWSDTGLWVSHGGTLPPVFTVPSGELVATLTDATNISNATGTNVNLSGTFTGSVSYQNGNPVIGPSPLFLGVGANALYYPDGSPFSYATNSHVQMSWPSGFGAMNNTNGALVLPFLGAGQGGLANAFGNPIIDRFGNFVNPLDAATLQGLSATNFLQATNNLTIASGTNGTGARQGQHLNGEGEARRACGLACRGHSFWATSALYSCSLMS